MHTKPNPPRPPPRPCDDDQNDNRAMNHLARAISDATAALAEFRQELKAQFEWFKSNLNSATKLDLEKLGDKIMSKISDYTTAVNAKFDEIDSGLETSNTKLTGITDDVAFLKETIEKLQSNPGPITPEDQALLDAAQARVNGAATKIAAFKTALEALDAATERPIEPPVPA